MNDLQLRPAQQKILEYENGRLAISAVPGSGKTFTLSLLAAKLIGNGRIDPNQQQILIVTYLNSSVDNFKARIRQRLEANELPDIGYTVRTLHSLALEIVRSADSGLTDESGRVVLEGPADDLKNNEDVREFYLGLTLEGKRKSYRDMKHYRRRKRWLG